MANVHICRAVSDALKDIPEFAVSTDFPSVGLQKYNPLLLRAAT